MKILGIGNYKELSYNSTHWLGHVEAFAELGHQFEYRDYHKDSEQYRQELFWFLETYKPDIIILGISSVFEGTFLEKLRERTSAKIVWWYCDFADYEVLGDPDVIRRPVNRILDYVFITNREQIPFYQKTLNLGRVYYLPQACLKREKMEDATREYDKDVAFWGEVSNTGIRRERFELLDYVRNAVPQFVIYPNADMRKDDSYKLHHKFYPSIKVTLGESWNNDKDLYTSNRIFIVTGNGGFYLCKYFKNMEEVWDIGKHLDVFHTKEEAVDKIRYYLNHREEREQIRRQGFEYSQKYHNYTVRLQNMLDIVEGKTEDFYGYRKNIKER